MLVVLLVRVIVVNTNTNADANALVSASANTNAVLSCAVSRRSGQGGRLLRLLARQAAARDAESVVLRAALHSPPEAHGLAGVGEDDDGGVLESSGVSYEVLPSLVRCPLPNHLFLRV